MRRAVGGTQSSNSLAMAAGRAQCDPAMQCSRAIRNTALLARPSSSTSSRALKGSAPSMRAACSSAQPAAYWLCSQVASANEEYGPRVPVMTGCNRAVATSERSPSVPTSVTALLETFDRLAAAPPVVGAVRELQQASEERAIVADDARHLAHRARVAADRAHEPRQQRRPARQVLRLELEIGEHARRRLERGELRCRRLALAGRRDSHPARTP